MLQCVLMLGTLFVSVLGVTNEGEPVVEWRADQVTIYDNEKHAVLYLGVDEPGSFDVTIELLSYGVGLVIARDVIISDTAIIPAGECKGSVNVSVADEAVGGGSENGYRKLRIRLNEVIGGKATIGDYGFIGIMDVNILGHSTSETGCRSGSLRTSRVVVSEADGAAVLTFIVNEPLSHDIVLGYRVDLAWTGTTSHAHHRVDYFYSVDHHREGVFKNVTLRAGDTSVNIRFDIIDDDEPEDTEQFIVHLEHGHLSSALTMLSDSAIVDIEDNDRCPGPLQYEYYDGSCYFKVSLPGEPVLMAADASELCLQHDGHLAIITGEMENTIVGGTADNREAWIGAIRDQDNMDTFIWFDGSPLVYDSWRKREPNNLRGNEDCVKTNHVRLGLWNDTPCRDRSVRIAVCEKPAVTHSPIGWIQY